MFLFHNRRALAILLIDLLLILLSDDNGRQTLLLNKSRTVAAAQTKNKSNQQQQQQEEPNIQIQRHNITRLTITNPHLPYYIPCNPVLLSYDAEDAYNMFCTWYRNDEIIERITTRKNDFFIYENGTLRLPPNERASGVYRCRIDNITTGVISNSVTVEYPVLKRFPPSTLASATISAHQGQVLVLTCPVYSVPAARISWYFGNDTLANDSSAIILANGTLVLRTAKAGKYKCVAQNQYAIKGHRQYMWMLQIADAQAEGEGETAAGPAPALATQLLPALQNATQYLAAGGKLLLQCRAVADNLPIEWWFLSTNNTLTKLSNNSVGHLITNANVAQHEGHYTCVTPQERQTFHVIVTRPPRITSTLPVETAHITFAKTLTCQAEGNPRPSLTWYHNGLLLNSSYTRYISGNDLHIHSFDPEEEGIYQCFARNVAGEDYVTGQITLKQQLEQPNPMQNIRCYPHSFNTINVTFDSRIMEPIVLLHIVRSNPHIWSSFGPMRLNLTSYVVISSHLPIYRPFALITRVLFPTSDVRSGSHTQQQTMLSSLRSPPVSCCTQGLLLHLVHLDNDTFVTWSQVELDTTKYFILQYSINHTHPHPAQLLEGTLRGTVTPVELNADIVRRQLTLIRPLNQTAGATVLHNAEHEVLDNEVDDMSLEMEEDIFSLVVHANVTGLLMQHFARIKMRVLIITSENEYLGQDFRYVQWKIIENDTSEQTNMPFRLTTVESRMLSFQFLDSFNDSCVYECHLQIQYPYIRKEEHKCKERTVVNTMLRVGGLLANVHYNFHFYNCETHIFYGQFDVQTLPDPPGTISNSQMIIQNGLKLTWEPPLQPNGRVHHYNILWTLENVTHEVNVINRTFYKFPNISEADKIHVAVRVVGETGVGAPMYFDLTRNSHHTLQRDPSTSHSEVYSGIAIGTLLSVICVLIFALFIIVQRRRLKARQQGPTHLTTPTDINFGNLSNAGMPGDSAGGLSGSTLQQDYHEMQTLIPRSRYHIELLPEHRREYQTSTPAASASAAAAAAQGVCTLPNGNGNGSVMGHHLEQSDAELSIAGVHNLSQLPLCGRSSPERKSAPDIMLQKAKAFYIPYRHTPPNAVALQSSDGSCANNGHKQNSSLHGSGAGGMEVLSSLEMAMPPNSLPLVSAMSGLGGSNSSCSSGGHARRSGSLSSNSASSNGNGGGSKKQYHTNFPKHSNSNDGICLLAEEESAATLTPTSEHEYVVGGGLTNGFKLPADIGKMELPSKSQYSSSLSKSNNNNGSSSSSHSSEKQMAQLKDRPQATNRRAQQPGQQGHHSVSHPISFSHNTSIVPANGPHTQIAGVSIHNSHSNSGSTTAAAKQPWPAAKSLHRRAQVDPNG